METSLKKDIGMQVTCKFILNHHQVMNLILCEMEKNSKFDIETLAGKGKLTEFIRDKLLGSGQRAFLAPTEKMLLRRQDVLSALKGVIPMSG